MPQHATPEPLAESLALPAAPGRLKNGVPAMQSKTCFQQSFLLSSNRAFIREQSDLERIPKPFRPAGRQNPGMPFQLELLRQGKGSAGGSRCWIPQQGREGAELWVAKSCAQDVTSVVHGGVGAGFFIPAPPGGCSCWSQCWVIKSCSSPGSPQPIPEAHAVSSSCVVWKFVCCQECSAWPHCLV